MLSVYDICKFLKHKILMPILAIPHLILVDKREVEKIQSNFNALKSLIDIKDLKPATGEFRKMQLKSFEFAKEMVSELEQQGINLIMTSGTLLGAERHGGFIPWDDDMDFLLMRSDFDRLKEIVEKKYVVFYQETNKYFPVRAAKKRKKQLLELYPNQPILLIYLDMYKFIKGNSIDDYAEFDIFAYDYYEDNLIYKDYIKYAEKKIKPMLWKLDKTEKQVLTLKNIIKNSPYIVEKSNKISYGIANPGTYLPSQRTDWWTYDDYFPLKRMKFEDAEFFAPNNHIKVLDYWCKNWRGIPNNIIPPHEFQRKNKKKN